MLLVLLIGPGCFSRCLRLSRHAEGGGLCLIWILAILQLLSFRGGQIESYGRVRLGGSGLCGGVWTHRRLLLLCLVLLV